MKTAFLSAMAVLSLTLSARSADVTTTISDVHLCCGSCVKGAQNAVSNHVAGVTAVADQDASTVTLTGSDAAAVQKAADALVAAGYFGKSSDAKITLADNSGAKDQKVKSAKVEGVHLCCGNCVKAVTAVVKAVPGAEAHTAVKGAKTFEVTGDFNEKALAEELHKAGLSGKVAHE